MSTNLYELNNDELKTLSENINKELYTRQHNQTILPILLQYLIAIGLQENDDDSKATNQLAYLGLLIQQIKTNQAKLLSKEKIYAQLIKVQPSSQIEINARDFRTSIQTMLSQLKELLKEHDQKINLINTTYPKEKEKTEFRQNLISKIDILIDLTFMSGSITAAGLLFIQYFLISQFSAVLFFATIGVIGLILTSLSIQMLLNVFSNMNNPYTSEINKENNFFSQKYNDEINKLNQSLPDLCTNHHFTVTNQV